MIKKLSNIFLPLPLLLVLSMCASTKKSPPLLKEEMITPTLEIEFDRDSKEEIKDEIPNTCYEDSIETFIDENIINAEIYKKSPEELILESLEKSTESTKGKHNFENAITIYDFKDGKIYSLLLSLNTITDIRLEEEEMPTGDIILSDSDNYIIETAVSFENNKQIYHIFIKCLDVSEQSTMILPTNKRTYYFKLIPNEKAGMLAVKFNYKNTSTLQKASNDYSSLTNIDSLNFNYITKGNNNIKPIAVFSDKKSTYIQFSPAFLTNSCSPALYMQSKNGFSIINYTIRGNMYITDFVLEKGEYFVLLQDSFRAEIKRAI